jgi:hypothetical protein
MPIQGREVKDFRRIKTAMFFLFFRKKSFASSNKYKKKLECFSGYSIMGVEVIMKNPLFALVVIVSLCIFACSTGEKAEVPETGDTVEQAGIVWQQLSLDEALALAKAQNKLVMIDFFSPT